MAFCTGCGRQNPDEAVFCIGCGAALPASAAAAAPPAAGKSTYTNFWPRVGAKIIDWIVVWVTQTVLTMPISLMMGLGAFGTGTFTGDERNIGQILAMLPMMGASMLISIAIAWLYNALLTSSSKQATLGKLTIGAIVTDLHGDRISFARASGRHFAEFLSGITLFIGYFIQPFTEKRQTLHDIVAGTLVVQKPV